MRASSPNLSGSKTRPPPQAGPPAERTSPCLRPRIPARFLPVARQPGVQRLAVDAVGSWRPVVCRLRTRARAGRCRRSTSNKLRSGAGRPASTSGGGGWCATSRDVVGQVVSGDQGSPRHGHRMLHAVAQLLAYCCRASDRGPGGGPHRRRRRARACRRAGRTPRGNGDLRVEVTVGRATMRVS